MPTVIRFISPTVSQVYGQQVFWKSRWEDYWTPISGLWASETTWACAPSLSTASLQFRYGDALQRNAAQFEVVFRASNRLRHFVRIDHFLHRINPEDESPTVRRWYGILDMELDELDGPFSRDPFTETAYARG